MRYVEEIMRRGVLFVGLGVCFFLPSVSRIEQLIDIHITNGYTVLSRKN